MPLRKLHMNLLSSAGCFIAIPSYSSNYTLETQTLPYPGRAPLKVVAIPRFGPRRIVTCLSNQAILDVVRCPYLARSHTHYCSRVIGTTTLAGASEDSH